jgi:serine phosphatase RsbU (regulator of sigma subunit)
MQWLRKKLLIKFILFEVALAAAGIGLWFVLPQLTWAVIALIAILSTVGFWWLVSRPFKKILREFKALITGKQYNRIYTKKIDEIGIIAHFFNEVTHSLARVSGNIKEHKRLATELNVARKIQQDLIPKKPPTIPGLDIIAKTKPAAEIGGDAFDFITKGDQSFMYIGDVTGHGVPSGLVMMIVDTLIHTFVDTCLNAHDLLVNVNKYLKPRIQTTMFMTMIMLRWKHETKEFFYAGAGHETLFHFKAAEGIVDNITGGGIALGMVPDNNALIKEQQLAVKEGDFVVLYTDGIVEARNENGEMYSIEMFKELVEKEAVNAKNSEELFNILSKEVLTLLGDFIQEDDMTLMVIKIGESQGQAATTEGKTTEWDAPEGSANPAILNPGAGEEGEETEESGLSSE